MSLTPQSQANTSLAHMVYFTLADASEAKQQALVDDCHKYLKSHPGVTYFAAGLRGAEFARPVNDTQHHVALIVVFDSKASHDAYQVHPDHVHFITSNKPNWKQIQVFDDWV